MKIISFIKNFALIFCLSFAVTIIVTYLYSLIVHGNGIIDWTVSFRISIILGIILPIVKMFDKNKD